MEETPRVAHRLIRASAGTGKTYQLSNRFLALLARGAAVDRILATTFTRKAAGEILDRVVIRLAVAVLDSAQRAALADALELPSLSADRTFELLQEVLHNLHRLRICTLDSFFAQLARGMSLELQLPPNWRILEDWQHAVLRDRGLDKLLGEGSTGRLHSLTHLLTKGEARRGVADLLRGVVQELHEIYQETTPAAWQALRIPPPLDDAAIAQAFQALADAECTGRLAKVRNADLERAASGDWELFISRGIANKLLAGESTYQRSPIPDELAAIYAPLMAHARAILIGRVAQQTQGTHRLLEQYDATFGKLKSELSVLRFQDLPHSLAAFEARQRAPSGQNRRLAFRLDGAVQHLLLDEFQDTSPVQWRALRGLARLVTSEANPEGSIFCVGDTKQAIYGWRGGVAEIFDAVEQELAGIQVSTLQRSYRSSPVVIQTVNRIFAGIPQHPSLERHEPAIRRWCSQFPVHSTELGELSGYASLCTAAGESTTPLASPVLETAARQVRDLVDAAPQLGVGILVRTNQCVGRMIYLVRQLGVRASEEGGNPLTDSAAVNLVLSVMQLADHPGDSVARFHFATSPLAEPFGFPDFRDEERAEELARELRGELLNDGYPQLVQRCAALLSARLSRREANRLNQLVELAYRFQPHATNRASDFGRFVQQQRVADPTTANVRVMTIHQAKGLEFDAVVLPELESELVGQPKSCVMQRPSPTEDANLVCSYANADIQQLLPQRFQKMFSGHSERMVAESLCLLYVAVTRAARALYMFIPASTASERKLPKRFSGLLRAALSDGEPAPPDSTLFEAGDPRWYAAAKESGPRATPEPEPAAATPIRFAAGRPRRRGLQRVSPSSLEGNGLATLDALLRTGTHRGMEWGSLMHAFFECLEWLDDGLPDPAALAEAARRLGDQVTAAAPVEEARSAFLASLEQPEVAAVLRQSYYTAGKIAERWRLGSDCELEVRNEHPFAAVDGERLVSGFIDRLVLIRQAGRVVGADVIDYKTDGLGSGRERLAAKVEFYRPQVDAYRLAVAKSVHLDIERVAARLVFVTDGAVAVLD